LQKQQTVKSHWVYLDENTKTVGRVPPSFVQLRSVNLRGASRSGEVKVAEQVSQLLVSAARSLHSPVLSVAALKVTAAEDHFVKVRQIIKDLIGRLEADASSETSQKAWCETQMTAGATERDAAQEEVESARADITSRQAHQDRLRSDIVELSADIAANMQALKEATELRNNEKAENDKTVTEAGEGATGVASALQLLRSFYENTFLQKSKFVPTNSDREGKTVSDRAPEVFDSEYKGQQEASKGIIGMLEVILSDFERTSGTVALDEEAAVTAFDTWKITNEKDTGVKETSKKANEAEIITLDDFLVTLQDSKKTAESKHAGAIKALEALHSMCIAGEESYEERVAKRNKEIEALKQAHDILENWQN